MRNKAAQLQPRPVLWIPAEIMNRLEIYIEVARGEISGLGVVEQLNHTSFVVTDIYLLSQVCTRANTKLSQDAIADLMIELANNGKDPGCLKLWWHSHANMEVFWSQEDETTIEGFKNDWMISLVGNKFQEFTTRLDIYKPARLASEMSLIVNYPRDTKLYNQLKQEVAEKVVFKEADKSLFRWPWFSDQNDLRWEEEDGLLATEWNTTLNLNG